MPFTTISRKILCGDLLPLCPLPPSSASLSSTIPMSVSYYEVIIVFAIKDVFNMCDQPANCSIIQKSQKGIPILKIHYQ